MAEDGIKKTMNWTIGISSIALIILMFLIIFGNLSGNVGLDSTTTTSYTNESCFINETGYTPTGVNAEVGYISYSISEVWINGSATAVLLPVANYTQTGNIVYNGTVTNIGWTDANITYTTTNHDGTYNSAESVITNMTSGLGKVTSQMGTILLFVGIGLLLFVLIGVLAWVIKKMTNMGGKSNLA